MKVKTITNKIGNDLYGKLECEHCHNEQGFVGYNDSYWWDTVLPYNYYCSKCNKNSMGEEPKHVDSN